MKRQHINDLVAFIEVARERSFTKAAAKLGVTQSALSHTIRLLEERLDLRLLTRSTRSVSPTDAGDVLLREIAPHFDSIATKLDSISALRDKPFGNIRITAGNYQIRQYLWPKLRQFLKNFPDVTVEVNVNYGLQDIVADGYDAGVRMGEQVAKDMVAVRLSPDLRFLVVGAPSYFQDRKMPETPRDLTDHSCINLRLPTYGGLYAWELEEDGRDISVRVEGRTIFNDIYDVIQAALDGFGLAHIPEDLARPHLESGELKAVLEGYCPRWSGFHLYYPSRRHHSPAFAALIKTLRYSG